MNHISDLQISICFSHLIVHLYTEKNKQQGAIAMIGLVAGISNALGIVLYVATIIHIWRNKASSY